ncbi:sulfatase family protein [Aquisalinus flavus]|nr:arylsulfatase [Aquisalinus flavus]MBD0425995.1 arylsulfatase [Aquisalinus flavus]UNE48413.1 sulfatase-like hydrolase/transferase [Aquisalinus flavus]
MSNNLLENTIGFRIPAIVYVLSIIAFTLIAASACSASPERAEHRLPNIIIMYADDLGYGDIGAYGATAISTPNIDALAKSGIQFMDAHASAATCTPSRYSLLTGEYAFRRQAQILRGDAPALIRPGQPTLASMLKSRGYTTAVVGKWHLGLGDDNVDWNGPVKPGPLEVGFDYSFLLPATGDRVPTVYVENHHVVGLEADDPLQVSYQEKIGDRPVGYENPDLLRQGADKLHSGSIVNGISRIGYMEGGKAAEWVDEDFPDIFTGKAIDFIRANKEGPFFLYFPFHDPHVPRLPHKRFQGSTQLGARGDAIVQLDWMTGQIVAELRRLGIEEDTLIVFSSDNGPVLNDGYEDRSVELLGDHKPAGPLRGGKYSAFEAGARVPTLLTWPGAVDPAISDALVSQVDFYASFAALVGSELRPTEAIDSENVLDALLGNSRQGRITLFKQSLGPDSLRSARYKYISPVPALSPSLQAIEQKKGVETGQSVEPQLYDLSNDLGERVDIAAEHPEIVEEMQRAIDAIRQRSNSP